MPSDPISTSAKVRRHLFLWLIFLTLVLIGTVIVLSSATFFFGVPNWALLAEGDVPYVHGVGENWRGAKEGWDGLIEVPVLGGGEGVGEEGNATTRWVKEQDWDGVIYGSEDWSHLENVELVEGERIPRIIHQTWKNDVLPARWRSTYQECRRGQDNFTYHLWTDSASRRFVSEVYPSFLPTYDSYTYPIQRADAIRYFVLHRFGGIYMDFDVGCRRDFSPLLKGDWDVVLAKTIPVGVSNDVMVSSKGSAFMDMTIHGLIAFNHHWVSNYPTVMFSTGPMFLSAQYSLYTSSHPLTPVRPTLEVRVLPKSLYGKNALPSESPHAFFSHDSASSWHSDDSKFFLFLGQKGIWIVRGGFFCVVVAGLRMFWTRGKVVRKSAGGGIRRLVIGLENVAQGGGVAGFSAGVVTGATTPGGGTYQLLSFLPTNSLSTSPVSTPSLSLPNSPTLHPTSANGHINNNNNHTLLPFSLADFHSSAHSSSTASTSPPPSPPLSSLSLAFRKANSYFSSAAPAIALAYAPASSSTTDPAAGASASSSHHQHQSSTSSDRSSTSRSKHPSPPSSSNRPRRKPSTKHALPSSTSSSSSSKRTGVLYFLPAFFAPHPSSSSHSKPQTKGGSTSRTNRKRSGTGRSSRPSSGQTQASHYPSESSSSHHHLLGGGGGYGSGGSAGGGDIESGLGEDYEDEDECGARSPVDNDGEEQGRKERTESALSASSSSARRDVWMSRSSGAGAGASSGSGSTGGGGGSRKGTPPPPAYSSAAPPAGPRPIVVTPAASRGGGLEGEEEWDVQWDSATTPTVASHASLMTGDGKGERAD